MVDVEAVSVVFHGRDPKAEPRQLRQQPLDERGLARVALADDGDEGGPPPGRRGGPPDLSRPLEV